MSRESIRLFYQELECNPALRTEALELQRKFSRQEDVMDSFIALGASRGFHFSAHDLIQYIFEHGRVEK